MSAQTRTRRASITTFSGVDLNSAPSRLSLSRSPDAMNMVRDIPGKVRKRMGYALVESYPGRINGVHTLRLPDGESTLVHAADRLYLAGGDTALAAVADDFSRAWQFSGKLYIADGERLRVFDGTTVEDVQDGAYVPTIEIGRAPSGGGTAYEARNLLGGGFSECFCADGVSTVYQLSVAPIDSDSEIVEVLGADGEWTQYENGTHYTLNPQSGTVVFTAAPAAPSVMGTDNVRVTARATRQDFAERINRCRIGTVYGVGGAADRLFLSGNPSLPNCDWFSGLADPTYFPENNRCELGQDSCEVAGYSIINNCLAAHKSVDADDRNIVIRRGEYTDGRAIFPVVGTLSGQPAVSRRAFARVLDEPLFLTPQGVYAITAQDVTGERYTQNRSYYINAALIREPDKDGACACVFRDYYIIAVNGRLYLLDTLAKEYQSGAPYSSYQYECFVCDNVAARCIYVENDRLRFGTREGEIMEFFDDPASPNSYTDCGEPVSAYWTLPDIGGEDFYRRKAFKAFAVKLMSAVATSAEVFASVDGFWQSLFTSDSAANHFGFSKIVFSKLSFSCDTTPKILYRRLALRRTPQMRFRLANAVADEPFGLFEVGVEYHTQGIERRE